MKLNLSILTGVTSLAALISGVFADTAVTDPVGYITLNVPGTANPASPKVSYLGASLVTSTVFAGSPVSSADSTHVTFAANSFPVAFGANSLGQATHYVEITSGVNAGVWSDILSSTTDTLTLNDPIGAMFTPSVSVKIRKHQTIAGIFGDNTLSNPLTLQGGVDNTSADLVELVSAAGLKQIFFNTDEDAWFNGPLNSNEQIVAPGDGIRLSRRGAAKTITLVGHVKTGPTVIAVETGVNLIASPLAVPTTGAVASPVAFNFDNSGLLTSGLVGGVDNTSADNILQLDSTGAPTDLFYNTDETAFFSGPNPVGANDIKEGTAIRLFHRGGGFNWVIPPVLIAQ